MNLFVELTSALGKDAAIRLLAKFGGRTLYFPKLQGQHEAARFVDEIITLHRDGCNAVQIAGRVFLDVSTVIDVLESCLTSDLK